MNWYFLAWSLMQFAAIVILFKDEDLHGSIAVLLCYLIFFVLPSWLLWEAAKIGF